MRLFEDEETRLTDIKTPSLDGSSRCIRLRHLNMIKCNCVTCIQFLSGVEVLNYNIRASEPLYHRPITSFASLSPGCNSKCVSVCALLKKKPAYVWKHGCWFELV